MEVGSWLVLSCIPNIGMSSFTTSLKPAEIALISAAKGSAREYGEGEEDEEDEEDDDDDEEQEEEQEEETEEDEEETEEDEEETEKDEEEIEEEEEEEEKELDGTAFDGHVSAAWAELFPVKP